ncbi:MAG: hypothetical protein P4L84_21025 [Isosphaeraceae bacterium]|nr:hypothetical protein [Isosphaeraceae bacterium]
MSKTSHPTGVRDRWVSTVGLSVGMILVTASLHADERAARSQEMKELVMPLRASKVENGGRVPGELSREPLLRWSDPTRENSDGSLWAFGISGRPIAIVAVEFYPNHRLGEAWAHEFVSLSTGPIEVDGGTGFEVTGVRSSSTPGHFLWTPKEPGVTFRDIPDASSPGTTEAKRLRQMKELAERFSATEYYEAIKQTYSLRLSPHPIHRYHDAAAGVVDGAIFEVAHGTNPEVLLLIEAQARDTTAWCWAAARFSSAELTLSLDRKPVWTVPTTQGGTATETYAAAIKLRVAATAEGNTRERNP